MGEESDENGLGSCASKLCEALELAKLQQTDRSQRRYLSPIPYSGRTVPESLSDLMRSGSECSFQLRTGQSLWDRKEYHIPTDAMKDS